MTDVKQIAADWFYRIRDWTRDDEKHYEPSGEDPKLILELVAAIEARDAEHADRLCPTHRQRAVGATACPVCHWSANLHSEALDLVREERDALREQVARLRDALEEVLDYPASGSADVIAAREAIRAKARAALSTEAKPESETIAK